MPNPISHRKDAAGFREELPAEVEAGTGIAVLFALIRGFIKVKSSGLGSFWVDLTRIVVHILLPLNLVISLLLVGGDTCGCGNKVLNSQT